MDNNFSLSHFILKVFNFTRAKLTLFIFQPFQNFFILNIFAFLRVLLEKLAQLVNMSEPTIENPCEVLVFYTEKGRNNELRFFKFLIDFMQRNSPKTITIIFFSEGKNNQKYFAIGNMFKIKITFEIYFDRNVMKRSCSLINSQTVENYNLENTIIHKSPLEVISIPKFAKNNTQIYLRNFGFSKKVCIIAPNSEKSLISIIKQMDQDFYNSEHWVFVCLFEGYSDLKIMPKSKSQIYYPSHLNFTFFEALAFCYECDMLVGEDNIFSELATFLDKRVTVGRAKSNMSLL
jgi:hypothetical protein